MDEENRYDVVVIGGGPAGLTAALYCGRALLKTVVLDKFAPGGQLLNTELIEDYPGFDRISGADLAERIYRQATKFGVEFKYRTVTSIDNHGLEKMVTTDDGDRFVAGAVIVCTGGSPKRLNIPGESELAGRGVSYCAICDGPFFRDQVVTVVGGGDSAVEEAEFLARFARQVYLIHRRGELRAQPVLQQRVFTNPKIKVIWNTIVEEIGGDQSVAWLRLRHLPDGHTYRLPANAVFVYVGFNANNQSLPPGVQLDNQGFVLTDARMETAIPGLFVAGDVHSSPVRQITNAVGDATTAAVEVYRYLEALRELEEIAPHLGNHEFRSPAAPHEDVFPEA